MIARALRAAALLAMIGTAGCMNRTTIVYPPLGSERPQGIPDPRCSPDWSRIASGRSTIGELRTWVTERERDRPCNGLALLAHRAAAVVDWRATDGSVGDDEIVRQVLVEVDRANPAGRPLRLHAMVGDGAGGAGPVTVLVEGPQGRPGEPGKDAGSTGEEGATRPGGSGLASDPPVSNPPGTGGTGDVPGPGLVTETPAGPNTGGDTGTGGEVDTATEPVSNDGNTTTDQDNGTGESGGGGRTGTTAMVVSAAAGAGVTYALSSLGLLGGSAPVPPGGRGRGANVARRIEPDDVEQEDDAPDAAAADVPAADSLWDSRLRVRSAGFGPGR